MDFAKVVADLRAELENLDAAIASLERLKEGGRRRGRPPGSGHAANKRDAETDEGTDANASGRATKASGA